MKNWYLIYLIIIAIMIFVLSFEIGFTWMMINNL
jgi:hypothetical protein